MSAHVFTMHLRVDDPGALHDAALRHSIQVDRLTAAEAIDIIGGRDNPDIAACLIAVLDPGSLAGCSISGSAVESV